MKLIEKASILRILNDMIRQDDVISKLKLDLYRKVCEDFGFTKDDELRAERLSLSSAIVALNQSDRILIDKLLQISKTLAYADELPSREQGLLVLALEYCLSGDLESSVVSLKSNRSIDCSNQIVYTEQLFNTQFNKEIEENYRHISKDLRYVGLEFVFVPKLIQVCAEDDFEGLVKALAFLRPELDEEQIDQIKLKFKLSTSASFTKKVVEEFLGEEIAYSSALMLQIGRSRVENEEFSNFLLINFKENVTKVVYEFGDRLSHLQHIQNQRVISKYSKGLLFSGYFKLLVENLLKKAKVRSSLLIDTLAGEIIFSDINEKLSGINRREKAMFVLFLLESKNGGIQFGQSDNLEELKDQKQRAKKLQNKYNAVYKTFGGDAQKAPDISLAEVRLPMISRIKKSIKKLSYKLPNYQDFIISRQSSGVYNLDVDPSDIFVRDSKNSKPVPVAKSYAFNKGKL